MEKAFLNILNMSITASYVIIFVILARLLLKKAPKIFSYCLWIVVLFRLICPLSFSFALSFLGLFKTQDTEYIPGNLGYIPQPQANTGIDAASNWSNTSIPAAASSAVAVTKQTVMYVISLIWIIGVISLLLYSCVSYIRLKRKVSTALLVKGNIFKCDNIRSPFVLGIIKPRIYLPAGLNENEESYILMHEQIHIRRFDFLIKILAFLISCIHWFNPLVWISFMLMSCDMEMSCDEGVLKKMGKGIKKDYSNSILALSFNRRILSGSPLAFGESNAKGRIKNVLNYRKSCFWVIIAAFILVGFVGVGLASNPKKESSVGAGLTGNIIEDKQKDVSYLNIKNIKSGAAESKQLIVRVSSGSASIISGSELSSLIDNKPGSWVDRDAPENTKLTPDLRVYINIGSNYKLNFYKSQPELVQATYGEYCRYYKIPKDTYEKLFFMYAVRSYMIPNTVMSAVADGKMTNLKSTQDVPNNGDCKVLRVGDESFYIYKVDGKYYVEKPYQFISEITQKQYNDALGLPSLQSADKTETSQEIKKLVDDNIAKIISSPNASSNPNDYIKANSTAYENILKNGEDSLSYMLSEFKRGNVKNDLRGQIMMRLCKDLLGGRNNVADETLLPAEWYGKLSIRQRVELPDFVYEGNDPVLKLVYSIEIEKHKGSRGEFTIIAPHIYGSYEEGDRLKVFVTTFSKHYYLYDKTVTDEGGSVIPAAITYIKDASGSYSLEKYEQAKDGSYFGSSIRDFCVMPLSGKKINNLADTMLKNYSNRTDLTKLERENLIEHLNKNNQNGVFLLQKGYQKPEELIPLT